MSDKKVRYAMDADKGSFGGICKEESGNYFRWWNVEKKWYLCPDDQALFWGFEPRVIITEEQALTAIKGGVYYADVIAQVLHNKDGSRLILLADRYYEDLKEIADCLETDEERITAFMIDSLNSRKFSVNDIKRNFGENVANAIDILSSGYNDDYAEFIKRCGENKIARNVKIAELEHCLKTGSDPDHTKLDEEEIELYKEVVKYLKSLD